MRRGGACCVSAIAGAGVAAGLAGCVSSEQKAAWAHVESARIIASQNPTVVAHADSQVRVTGVSVLQSSGRLAVAVRLRNLSSRPVNDLPISLRLRSGHGPALYLNRSAGLDYFDTHVAVIPAAGRLTWVYSGPVPRRERRSLLAAGTAVARVGPPSQPAVTVATRIPPVKAVLSSASGRTVRIRALNLSSVPQVPLQLYALASTRRGLAAVGSGTVANLGSGSAATASIRLIGRGGRYEHITVEVLPTLFN